MSEINDQNEPPVQDTSSEELKRGFSGFMDGLKNFLKEIFDIRGKTDKDAAKESIKDDIPFKGHTAWIMVCSILIASVGLNANSSPVIIGAMLISPLMGPILGIGLSIAVNDIDTLRRALVNFGVMVFLSVLTAFLFFRFFPLREESSELLARTAPDIRDVLIAFFGGLALIIARTKKGTIASVIFGVAISTALMPPLCTAGWGLAIGKFKFFWGAMYLFTINTIFIALATYLILKLLRFRMERYANSTKRKRIAQLVSLTALLVMIPAVWTFYNVFQQSLFMKDANKFIKEDIQKTVLPQGGVFLNSLTEINYRRDSISTIKLFFMGDDAVPDYIESTWRQKKETYENIKNVHLDIEDGVANESFDNMKYLQELYDTKTNQLADRESRIKVLEDEVNKLVSEKAKSIPLNDWAKEAEINYTSLKELGFYYHIKSNFQRLDTIPVFTVSWKSDTDEATRASDLAKLNKWLALKIQSTKFDIKEEPSENIN